MLELLLGNRAETREDHPEPELRSRRYPVPFARVWEAAIHAMGGGLAGWTLTEASEDSGEAKAVVESSMLRQIHDVTLRVWLDPDGQTRVDVRSRGRHSRGDLGASRRHLRSLLRTMDRALTG